MKPNESENDASSRNNNVNTKVSKSKKDSAKQKSASLNKKSLFDSDSESDDLFNPKQNAHQQQQKKSIIQVEKNDEFVTNSNQIEVAKKNTTEKNIPNNTESIAPTIMLPKPKNPLRLFEDSSDDESNNNNSDTDEISVKSQTSKNSDFQSSSLVKSENIDHSHKNQITKIPVQKKSLFDDSSEEEEENADLFNNKVPNQDKQPKKPFTIFDNDSDDDEYEKLFASTKNSNNETTENSKVENAQIGTLESEDDSKDAAVQDQGEGMLFIVLNTLTLQK